MRTTITFSPLDMLIARLRKKGLHEFRMTSAGFTAGFGKFYEPRDLIIKKIYHFGDEMNTEDTSYVYLMVDKDGLEGYSIDPAEDFEINKQNLYHWFITKVPVAE